MVSTKEHSHGMFSAAYKKHDYSMLCFKKIVWNSLFKNSIDILDKRLLKVILHTLAEVTMAIQMIKGCIWIKKKALLLPDKWTCEINNTLKNQQKSHSHITSPCLVQVKHWYIALL